MGLAERRAAKQFQDNQFVQLQKEIHEAAGFAVPIDVAWDQLAGDEYSQYYAEWWPKVYFKPIIDGLGQITRDAMGKEAIKAGLKKIEIRNSIDTANYERAITFDHGVLTIDHKLSNIDHTEDRIKQVITVVEKGL